MTDLVALWSGHAFRERVEAWLDACLPPVGMLRTGAVVAQRVRFWSAVFHAPVSGAGQQRVWVKVGNPGQAFEGPLLHAVATLTPDRVVDPLAVDAARGWWVLPDGGPTLRDAPGGAGLDRWAELLVQVAHLQRQLAPHRGALRPVPALPLASVVDTVAHRIASLTALPPTHPQRLGPDAVGDIASGLARLGEAVELLTGLGIPDTLQPNDVHPGNALLPGAPNGPFRLFDLGDAFWAHPFGVLHLPLRLAVGGSLAGRLPDAAEVWHLAEGYLRQWPEAPRGRWREIVLAADRVGAVHRALSWERLLRHTHPAALADPPRVGVWLAQAVGP